MTATKAEDIAAQLRFEILSGHYRPGTRLPSERELALRFEASRGAVREALKKLEQLGIAQVLPGGARAAPLEHASLEVISHLLDLEGSADLQLVDQVMEVISALMEIAVRRTLTSAPQAALDDIRALLATAQQSDISGEARAVARMEMANRFMDHSQQLIVKIISRSLRLQFMGRVPATSLMRAPTPRALELSKVLDDAIVQRDVQAACRAMKTLFEIGRKQFIDALKEHRQNGTQYLLARQSPTVSLGRT